MKWRSCPPFSGGSGTTGYVHIQKDPFLWTERSRRLRQASRSIGAIGYLSRARHADISKAERWPKLEFEHYPGIGRRNSKRLERVQYRNTGVIDATIIHRIGTLPIGENIVLIAVAAQHRDEAFKACRFCIDECEEDHADLEKGNKPRRGRYGWRNIHERAAKSLERRWTTAHFVRCRLWTICVLRPSITSSLLFSVPQEHHAVVQFHITTTPGGFPARDLLLFVNAVQDHAPFVGTVLISQQGA